MTKGRKNTRRSLVLSAELAVRIQAEQERTGAPVAEIIRRALDAYLTPREQAARKAGGR
jgi:predicted DNA-binding protein